MRVGIYIASRRAWGGSFQYSINLATSLMQNPTLRDGRVFYAHPDILGVLSMAAGWSAVPVGRSTPDLAEQALFAAIAGGSLAGLKFLGRSGFIGTSYEKIVRHQIDLMFCTTPDEICLRLRMPYVVTIHDLQHRLQPEFPEVSSRGRWLRREFVYRNAVERAAAVLVDSEAGKEDVLRFYRIPPDRIHILPLRPSLSVKEPPEPNQAQDVRRKYSLPERYVFYPAAFWEHKNHLGVLEALRILRERMKVTLHAVFCGPRTGGVATKVEEFAARHSMRDKVLMLDYVPDQDMAALYAEALALVMPTFFGPSNTPVWEAFLMRCPVITSDLHGIREQVGGAGILVDPHRSDQIAEAIHSLHRNEDLRQSLIRKGLQRMSGWTDSDYSDILQRLIRTLTSR